MFLFLHAGAGSSSYSSLLRLKKILKQMLLSSDSLKELAKEMEESSMLNCGKGSNKTQQNAIENECCQMSDKDNFISLCLIPSHILPYDALQEEKNKERQKGLVVPLSTAYRTEGTFKCPTGINNEKDISLDAPNDTVGIIEVTNSLMQGYSSSGGLKKKYPGRIGPCSVYGANTFVTKNAGVVISGTGESLIKWQLAKRIHKLSKKLRVESIKTVISRFMKEESEFPYMAGIAVVKKSSSLFLIHFQTAESFLFGYKVEKKVRIVLHRQKAGEIFINMEKIECSQEKNK
ncbi:taspase, threonine aspartase, 1 [Nematocida ausubeli]|uniref:Uncharacterized protein n=1 Tax=Nematocida ausubeli (strain ATCC PRA-371 / ERTm2) TaxID=1913371 RepID=H8ZCY8_NEMA1|nr:uncharacterized protein NESG_02469 [Nematocida ausubeli]EHY65528.1 hypothetical protein NERG_01135 [Nematocida ausubeli]KAI5137964.1 taspase, threonine aspartase, 1 [Nematocida ausubeli]KAI5138247.1 taspase, threonine aspartase, 1 [Nematocida ausubeli]KAI5151050.1 taspase, threonine aspartase, 1 [Nematocida ausubeli]KAI5164570.1 taspase, threonine aspartase, 1 [Nematocida ausubeli]